jgi:hypothetical protein
VLSSVTSSLLLTCCFQSLASLAAASYSGDWAAANTSFTVEEPQLVLMPWNRIRDLPNVIVVRLDLGWV